MSSTGVDVHRAEAMTTSTAAPPPAHYSGLLFPERAVLSGQSPDTGSFVRDLNLDQIVEAIVAKREDPDFLRPHFMSALHEEDLICYRQEIFKDLESSEVFTPARQFADALRAVRDHLRQASKMHHPIEAQGWLLDAGAIYCDAVENLLKSFNESQPASRGLRAFEAYLSDYINSPEFVALREQTATCKETLGSISYCMRITPGRIDIVPSQGEPDYSAEVEKTFERFRQGAVRDYRVTFRGWPGVDRIGGEVLTMVAKLFPQAFAQLTSWCERHRAFFDCTVREAERELDFYLAVRAYIDPLRAAGLNFCFPQVTASKAVHGRETFDLALAAKIVAEKTGSVVTNDFELSGSERIFVISGPNQGGKTTFARTFGQLHHLGSLGLPVPGTEATLTIFDHIFTHFEREEDLVRLSGKLEDDLVRIHEILTAASPMSIVILNEIFTSTALSDARTLGAKIMERLIDLDLLCVFVTFVDEMATMGQSVVSMMSKVVPSNPAERTFKVVRAPADGLAHALALAEKHHVTYDQIKERLAS
jgi:DNA mismatch repair protein MutS